MGGTLGEIAAAEAEVTAGRHSEQPFILVVQQSQFDPSRAPAGKHTAWAYCHVPSGSTVDMTARIEAQIERFAPGFGDIVLARATRTAPEVNAYNENYIGGDINVGLPDWRQLIFRPIPSLEPVRDARQGHLPRLVGDSAGRRRPRDVRPSRGAVGAEAGVRPDLAGVYAELVAHRVLEHGPAEVAEAALGDDRRAEADEASDLDRHVLADEVDVDAVLHDLGFRHLLEQQRDPRLPRRRRERHVLLVESARRPPERRGPERHHRLVVAAVDDDVGRGEAHRQAVRATSG